jgi:FG-GAP repeat
MLNLEGNAHAGIAVLRCLSVGPSEEETMQQARGIGLALTCLATAVAAADWAEQAMLTADDGLADDWFGSAVALQGDVAVLGAMGCDASDMNSGAAYIFRRSGDTWAQHQKLSDPDGGLFDSFGRAVAIDGDTIAVGANKSDGPVANCGAAFVYVRSGDTWMLQQKLTAADAEADDTFGFCLDLQGDTLAIGAYGEDALGASAGAAYVFTRSDGVWSQQAKLTASDGVAADQFGTALCLNGDSLAMGAPYKSNMGAVYVFVNDGGVWSEQQRLTAPDGAVEDGFGNYVVELDGDTLLVGSPFDDDLGDKSGSAYAFTRTAGVWTFQQKLLPSDGEARAYFAGWAGALDGDTFVASAHYHDEAAVDSGVAYLFTRSGGVWTEQQKVVGSDTGEGDAFSIALALDGQNLLAGASYHDAGADNSGGAYVFVTADAPCPGDLDGDNDVDQSDLGLLLASYLVDDGGDLDGDGDTDQSDLGVLLANYGLQC